MTNSTPKFILDCQNRISDFINNRLVTSSIPAPQLKQALIYTTSNGGKRVRPILIYATGLMLGAKWEQLDIAACAIEWIHTYSLIHDDLPAMDNDDMRRNMPSCHKAFDEATAILAGDALQAMAFDILQDGMQLGLSALQCLKMVNILAQAAGPLGMVAGQSLDLAAIHTTHLSLAAIEKIHQLKTGALFKACIDLAIVVAHSQNEEMNQILRDFVDNIGLAFQLQDDIADYEGALQTNALSFVSQLDLQKTVAYLKELYDKAYAQLEKLSTFSLFSKEKPMYLYDFLNYLMKPSAIFF